MNQNSTWIGKQTSLIVLLATLFVSAASQGQTLSTANTARTVLVEGGTFQMGSEKGYIMERPVHEVSIKSFYIDKYEVTVEEYQTFCEQTGRQMPAAPPWGWKKNNPIVNVSWDDASAYATWIGKRLPTEAEWEFAASGGTMSKHFKYSGSDDIGEVAWFDENSDNIAHPVGEKGSNELGIYDMTGNAVEWCGDKYDGNYYAVSPKENPEGPKLGNDRVLRGGSYLGDPDDCRITKRFSGNPRISLFRFGFRCALDK